MNIHIRVYEDAENGKRNSARSNFRYERKNFEKVTTIMLDFDVLDTLCFR